MCGIMTVFRINNALYDLVGVGGGRLDVLSHEKRLGIVLFDVISYTCVDTLALNKCLDIMIFLTTHLEVRPDMFIGVVRIHVCSRVSWQANRGSICYSQLPNSPLYCNLEMLTVCNSM